MNVYACMHVCVCLCVCECVCVCVFVCVLVHKQMFYIRMNLRMLQHSHSNVYIMQQYGVFW